MIGIIVAIALTIWFYRTAQSVRKSPLLWAGIGFASYYAPVVLYSLALRRVVPAIEASSSLSAVAMGLSIGLSAVLVGAVSAFAVRWFWLLAPAAPRTDPAGPS